MRAGGAFIAVEGGEGAGKGSILQDLAARLAGAGFTVLQTREPGGTKEGLALRQLLLGAEGEIWDPWAELLLMTAARIQHVRRVIAPAIARGEIVISDRFAGSTLAYQGAGHGLEREAIEALHAKAVGGLWPDLTVLLDIDPRIGVRRSLARLGRQQLDEGRFEGMRLDFHDRVRASFLAQAAARPLAHVVIDAALPLPDVASAAARAVFAWLRDRQIKSSAFPIDRKPL